MQFLPNFQKKYHVLSFLLMSIISMVRSDSLIFDNAIRFTLKVSSVRILLSIGSLNGKNRFPEGHPNFFFYIKFPFVNLQIKSVVESLRPIKSGTH